MKLPFATTIARWRGTRLLRALLTEQRRTADALEALTRTVDALGQMLAVAHHQAWAPLRVLSTASQDASSVGSPGDAYFADIEAIQEDYRLRHGREISEDETLSVYADHQAARQADGDPQDLH